MVERERRTPLPAFLDFRQPLRKEIEGTIQYLGNLVQMDLVQNAPRIGDGVGNAEKFLRLKGN